MKINRIIQISLDGDEFIRDFEGYWYVYTDCAYSMIFIEDDKELIKKLDKIVKESYND